ncbi:MAG: hypothetical protein WHU95_04485 [candidate division WOR-3 bacterium]|jgi:hypothetical protein|nr:hypothetical protein [candidate division WOR-3 bacterium]MDH7518935.1 hypothetical protein [bacterium]
MKYAFLLTALTFFYLSAQPYRCDWSVSGIGGGEMSGGNFRSSVTAGQTAIGRLTGTNLLALIGFWQTDVSVGIAEEQESNLPCGLKTGLERTIPTRRVCLCEYPARCQRRAGAD